MSYALADAPVEVERTLETLGNSEDPIHHIIERSPAPLVYFGESIMVEDCVLECIEHHKDHGRFIIGVCDQVAPDGVIERVKLITDLVEEHGRYE